MFTIGLDTGGTFSDCVAIDERGHIVVEKAPSTPEDFAQGVLEVLEQVRPRFDAASVSFYEQISSLAHGSTITTNAVITGSGARVGLLTTIGHRDILPAMRVIGRVAGLRERELLDYAGTDKPAPIVPRRLIQEVQERIDYKGAVVLPVNMMSARKGIETLLNEGVEAIGVCLLWSFMNPSHEQQLKALIQEMAPGLPVSISSEIVPKLGDYERTETTVLNAYTTPVLRRYLSGLTSSLHEKGLRTPLLIMQSTGGVIPSAQAMDLPVTTLASGPAGGVIGAQYLGSLLGHPNIVCTDVGGTSFDVGLVVDGYPLINPFTIVNQHTLLLPTVDITSIGSGGGSIARVVQGPSLKVGPQSAGAKPGPACYDLGGTEPTVTDADVILGYINPEYFLGGRIKLNRLKAERAVKEKIADSLGMTVEEAAAGIVRIVNSQMADLIRKVTVERGYDPRDFVLYAYGGAGPIHAPSYGAELGVRSIVVPLGEMASVFSAFGIGTCDIMHVYELSKPLIVPFGPEEVNRQFEFLESRGLAQLEEDGIRSGDMVFQRFVEMRYKFQVHQVQVPVPERKLDESSLVTLIARFEEVYESLYGKGAGYREAGIELITCRLNAIGRRSKPALRRKEEERGSPLKGTKAERPVYWPEARDFLQTPVYKGSRLAAGQVLSGPAVIEMATTTVLVHPRHECKVDEYGNLAITFA